MMNYPARANHSLGWPGDLLLRLERTEGGAIAWRKFEECLTAPKNSPREANHSANAGSYGRQIDKRRTACNLFGHRSVIL